jgi:hypothetical protein
LQAIDAEKAREYRECVIRWEECYQLINNCLISIDDWYAYYLTVLEGSDVGIAPVAYDGHDLKHLRTVFEVLKLAQEGAETERQNSLNRLYNKRDRTASKLAPLRVGRDAVRQRIGDDRWRNNPKPKMDYAMQMLDFRAELEALNVTITGIEALAFINNLILSATR